MIKIGEYLDIDIGYVNIFLFRRVFKINDLRLGYRNKISCR